MSADQSGLAHQLRQLGDVRSNPSRLISAQQLRRRLVQAHPQNKYTRASGPLQITRFRPVIVSLFEQPGRGAPMNVSKPTVERWGNALSVVVGVIVVVLFSVASVKVISYLANAEDTVERYMSKTCSQLEQSGLEAKWEYGEGCLVNIDGRWVPERKVPK